jgi:hypothetical protein
MSFGRSLIVLGLIFLALLTRFLPHPPNFNAINAIALFSASVLGGRRLALLIVFCVMFLSDLVLGAHSQMVFVYASLALTAVLGSSRLPVYFSAPASSLLFFAVVNFGVWLWDGLYPQNAAGLVMCYIAALPFYANQLFGDLFYTAALFGVFHGATSLFNSKHMGFGRKVKEEHHCGA